MSAFEAVESYMDRFPDGQRVVEFRSAMAELRRLSHRGDDQGERDQRRQ